MTKLALGDGAFNNSQVLLSPLAIAGWCGLVTSALNVLPVGRLDGGRMFQAAYGKNSLALSSFFTYLGACVLLMMSALFREQHATQRVLLMVSALLVGSIDYKKDF